MQPPLSPGTEVNPPVSLCTLAGWLRHEGHDVRILDLDLDIQEGDGSEHERSVDLMMRQLTDFEPEMLAVTSMYNNSLQAARLVTAAKEANEALVTIAGGPHFGALSKESLERIPHLDFAVEGEGEQAISSLIAALENGGSWQDIPSLHFRDNGELRSNPQGELIDMSQLGNAWSDLGDAIDLRRYADTIPKDSARRLVYTEAGRGCPFKCTFCATAPFWRRKFRVKPVPVLIDELRFLYEELGYDSFVLVHDLLTVNKRFMSDFCDAMIEANMPVQWMANSRTDIKLPGLLPKMKAAGCWKLFFGVESASERMQEAFDKHLDQGEIFDTITELRDNGLSCTCSFVIGFEEETPEEISASVLSGARLKLLGAEIVQFHRLRLWPPARLTEEEHEVEFDLDSLRIEYPFTKLPPQDIEEIENDKTFFSGYFVPLSQAGTSPQLAQVEMFFHHIVALTPATVVVLGQSMGNELVPRFYDVLERLGGIEREVLDWSEGDLWSNWEAIRPWLDGLIATIDDERSLALLTGLVDYEEKRLRFTQGDWSDGDGAAAAGDGWVVFPSSVNASQIAAKLAASQPLEDDVLQPILVVLARPADGGFASYGLGMEMLPKLEAKDPELIEALNGLTQ